MTDDSHTYRWWVSYPNDTRKLSNASLTPSEAQKRWPGCEPDLSTKAPAGPGLAAGFVAAGEGWMERGIR